MLDPDQNLREHCAGGVGDMADVLGRLRLLPNNPIRSLGLTFTALKFCTVFVRHCFVPKIQCLKSIIVCSEVSFSFICPNQCPFIQLQITCQNHTRNPSLECFTIICTNLVHEDHLTCHNHALSSSKIQIDRSHDQLLQDSFPSVSEERTVPN
jgi:hypothetical protein